MKPYFASLVLLLWGAMISAAESPYKGEESRSIKSLSPMEVEGLLNGHGLSFAKAAELNHYPGPKHVLELSKELNLTTKQVEETERIFERMHSDAIRLGQELVSREEVLNQLFESEAVTAEALERQLELIGTTRGKLRGVHLKAHLRQRVVLTQHQLHLYDKLRGYGQGGHHQSHSHKDHN